MLGLVMVTAHSATDPWPRPDSPSGHVNEMTFTVDLLPDVRRFAAAHGRGFGLDDDATVDLMIAINELATNAVRHGSPLAWLRMWSADDRMCAEIHDSGNWTPLAAPGHVPPAADAEGKMGIWITRQICSAVDITTGDDGTTVRLEMPRRSSSDATLGRSRDQVC